MDGPSTEIKYIRVTNRNPYPLVDRYDNRIYEFPQDETRTIPLEAAAHIFGYTPTATEESAKLHCLKRFGMNRPEVLQHQEHEIFWQNLEIVPVSMRLVEVEADEDEPELEERLPKQSRKKRGRPRKRVLVPRAPEPVAETAPETLPAA